MGCEMSTDQSFYTAVELIRRGWTRQQIDSLGPPDSMRRTKNPKFRPIRLWKRDRVQAIERGVDREAAAGLAESEAEEQRLAYAVAIRTSQSLDPAEAELGRDMLRLLKS